MNPKIVLSFVAGAALASGIVYYAARPEPAARPILVSSGEQLSTRPAADPSEPADSGVLPPQEQTSRQERVSPTQSKPAENKNTPRLEEGSSVRAESPSSSKKPSAMVKTREERRTVAQVDPRPASVAEQAPVTQNAPAPIRQDPPPAPVQAPEPAATSPERPNPEPPRSDTRAESNPPEQQPHSVTLTPGTSLQVRVGETLSTKKSQPGDTFLATLTQPLVIDGFVIAERGARAEGRVVEADKAGKVKGVPLLVVELTRFNSSDGQSVKVHTSAYNQEGKSPTAKNAAKVGLGAALGAVIGAAAGGGKGAGIGAGVGGAAAAGDVMLTRGPDAEIPVETRLTFKVQEPVTITERLH